MKTITLIVGLLLGITQAVQGQDLSEYHKQYFRSGEETLPFRVLLPKNMDSDKEYPLLVFLHGVGERGSDNEKQLTHGASFFLKDSIRERFPAVVVFPQCPAGKSWNNALVTPLSDGRRMVEHPKEQKPNRQLELLEDLIFELQWVYPVNANRMYIGGLSNGGRGTLEMIRRNPKMFKAAIAICGGAHPEIAPQLQYTPLWLFHGDRDQVNPYHESADLYKALKSLNADVQLTTYPGVDHNAWDPTFAQKGWMEWLFSHKP